MADVGVIEAPESVPVKQDAPKPYDIRAETRTLVNNLPDKMDQPDGSDIQSPVAATPESAPWVVHTEAEPDIAQINKLKSTLELHTAQQKQARDAERPLEQAHDKQPQRAKKRNAIMSVVTMLASIVFLALGSIRRK